MPHHRELRRWASVWLALCLLLQGCDAQPSRPPASSGEPSPSPTEWPLEPGPTEVPGQGLINWDAPVRIGDPGGLARPTAVVRSDGAFVAVALVGEEHVYSVWSSRDGTSWRRSRDVSGVVVADIAADTRTFVIVAEQPDELSHGGILTSTDGLQWDLAVEDDTLTAGAHGPTGFLALGGPKALVSDDGRSWSSHATRYHHAPGVDASGLAWSDVDAAPWGGWVAVGSTGAGTGPVVGLSPDGVSWRLVSVATDADDLTDVACAAKACVAAGRHHVNADEEAPVAFWSADGETWQQVVGLGQSDSGLSYRVATFVRIRRAILSVSVKYTPEGWEEQVWPATYVWSVGYRRWAP